MFVEHHIKSPSKLIFGTIFIRISFRWSIIGNILGFQKRYIKKNTTTSSTINTSDLSETAKGNSCIITGKENKYGNKSIASERSKCLISNVIYCVVYKKTNKQKQKLKTKKSKSVTNYTDRYKDLVDSY